MKILTPFNEPTEHSMTLFSSIYSMFWALSAGLFNKLYVPLLLYYKMWGKRERERDE